MTKHTARRALAAPAAAGALALALVSSAAFSQAAPPQTAAATTRGLEEVVVTARYREENLQQTPIAITAITADDISQRGFTSTSDIGYEVPNATFRPTQQAFGNSMSAYIRGVGQYDFNFAFEPGVAIYVDDVYYPTVMGTQFDLMDLERIEVLRGPQGTLFGRGSIGGAIRYVSKQPRGDNTGFIEGTVGDYHRVDLRAGYDISIIPDKLFARITGVSKKQDGFEKMIDFACAFPDEAGSLPPTTRNRGSCQTGTLGGTDVAGARGQLRYVATDDLDFNLALDYQRDDSEARADTLVAIARLSPTFAFWDSQMFQKYGVHYDSRFLSGNPFVTYDTFNDPYSGLSFPPRTSLSQKGIEGTVNWKLNDAVSSKLIVAWRNWNGQFSTDQDGSPLGLSVVDGIQRFTYRTAELQVFGRLFDRLDWTVGGFYYHGNGFSTQQVELPGVLPPAALPPGCTSFTQSAACDTRPAYYKDPVHNSLLVNGHDVGRFENASGFLHLVYSLTDTIRFTAGGRYSSDKKHDDFDNTVFATPVDSNATRTDWLAQLDWKVTPTILLYTSASTGYRPPAYNPRPFQQSQFVAVNGEAMNAYEIGEKGDFWDHRLRVNLAGFYNDYKKRILPAGGVECLKTADGTVIPGPLRNPDPTGPSCLVNSIPLTAYINDPAIIRGLELEMTFRPINNLTVAGNVGFTNMSAETVIFAGNPVNGLTPTGNPIQVPKYNGSLSAQYVINLPNGAAMTPRYDAYVQTRICSGVPNAATGYTALTSCAAGYTLHNARLEYSNSENTWTAAVGVSNLTDKRYYLNIFDLAAFGEPTVEGQPGAPREWYLTLRRSFH